MGKWLELDAMGTLSDYDKVEELLLAMRFMAYMI